MANYSYKNFPYDLTLSHNTSVTERQTTTDGRMDDNRGINSTVT